MATDVRRSGQRNLRIVNVYDLIDAQSGVSDRLAQPLNLGRVIRHGGTLLGGDINTPRIRCDPRCQVDMNSGVWKVMIDKNGLDNGNDGKLTHHWTTEHQKGESVIDLRLENRLIATWTMLADDQVNASHNEVVELVVGVD